MQWLRQPLRRSERFTLIELVTVAAVLGILAAIAVPSYLKFTDNAGATATAANVRSSWVARNASDPLGGVPQLQPSTDTTPRPDVPAPGGGSTTTDMTTTLQVPPRVNNTSTSTGQGRVSSSTRAQAQGRGSRNRFPIVPRPPQP